MCSSAPLPQPPAAPLSTGQHSNPCVISPIELARSQDWGRGRGGDLGLVKLKFGAFACQGMGQAGNWETWYVQQPVPPCPFPVLPPIRPPARSGSNPPHPGCFIGQDSPLGPTVLPGSQPDTTNRAVTDLDQDRGSPWVLTALQRYLLGGNRVGGWLGKSMREKVQDALEGWHFCSGQYGDFLFWFLGRD